MQDTVSAWAGYLAVALQEFGQLQLSVVAIDQVYAPGIRQMEAGCDGKGAVLASDCSSSSDSFSSRLRCDSRSLAKFSVACQSIMEDGTSSHSLRSVLK